MESNRPRWNTIDLAKGILIIIVFWGHMIPGVRRTTFARYVIYAFHMPLFFFISGFLFRIEKMDLNAGRLARKYWSRMIFPWIIAVVFYYLSLNTEVTAAGFLKAFWYPYYHLWYIPGFLVYIAIVCVIWKIFGKTRLRWGLLLGIALLISINSRFAIARKAAHIPQLRTLLDIFAYDFRCYNFFFFPLGIFMRNLYDRKQRILPGKIRWVVLLVTIACVAYTIWLFWENYPRRERGMYLLGNTFLCVSLIDLLMTVKIPRCRVLEFLGRNSLPVYLYHVEGKNLAAQFAPKGTLTYYALGVLLFIVISILIYYLGKIEIVNRIVFGMPPRKQPAVGEK